MQIRKCIIIIFDKYHWVPAFYSSNCKFSTLNSPFMNPHIIKKNLCEIVKARQTFLAFLFIYFIYWFLCRFLCLFCSFIFRINGDNFFWSKLRWQIVKNFLFSFRYVIWKMSCNLPVSVTIFYERATENQSRKIKKSHGNKFKSQKIIYNQIGYHFSKTKN